MKNYRDCFNYFIKRYKEQTGKDYQYHTSKLGLEIMKIKRLKLKIGEFLLFINWLCKRKKLANINFLKGQLNDYYASQEYTNQQVILQTLMHEEIMTIRKSIIGKCEHCRSTGYLDGFVKCKCMEKFLKIRDKIRSIYNESKTS